jgi:nicotinamidase-related amidase
MKKDALLIVDVQAAFPIPPAIVARIETYSRRFKHRIFTKFVNPPGSFFRTQLGSDSCAPGSPDTRLLIPPKKGDWVFSKASYGLRPYPLAKLKKLRLHEIEVCGIDTDACVLGTMFSLFDAKIRARVVSDLCWSSQDLHHEAMAILKTQFLRPHKKRQPPRRRDAGLP